jgi:DNA-binding CsgD family transcriptional regulator
MAVALSKEARIAWLQQAYEEAEQLYGRSATIYREIYDPGGLATALHGLGDTALSIGDYRAARSNYKEALEITAEMKWLPLTLAIFVGVGNLLWQVGQPEQSMALLALVVEHPAADHETKDLAERGLARARAELSSEILEAAKNRGQRDDLAMMSALILQKLETPFEQEAETAALVEMTGAEVDQPLVDPLTPRELEVLNLIAAGLSNREIAERLVISVGTVKSYTGQIYSKLQVNSRTQAVAQAREVGLLS